MGNRGTKAEVDKILEIAGKRGGSRADPNRDFAACLASLSDMAQTGIDAELPAVAGGGAVGGPHNTTMSPEALREVKKKLKSCMRGPTGQGNPTPEDLCKQLDLLEIQSDQDEESTDWASMRAWLLWCMHTNLDHVMEEEDEITDQVHTQLNSRRRRSMQRQTSVDDSRSRRLSHQHSLDADHVTEGNVTAQSSLDSTCDT